MFSFKIELFKITLKTPTNVVSGKCFHMFGLKLNINFEYKIDFQFFR